MLAARQSAGDANTIMVFSGDHPLISSELLEQVVAAHGREGAAAVILTTSGLDPTGYGRIVRAGDGSVERIVETKDPSGVPEEELSIQEINLGAYAFDGPALWDALERVQEQGGERYLTGVFPVFLADGQRVVSHETSDLSSAMGVNDRADLMAVDALAQRALLDAHAKAGVTFLGPESTRVEAGVEIGEDTIVWPGVTCGARRRWVPDASSARAPRSLTRPWATGSPSRTRSSSARAWMTTPPSAPSPTSARRPRGGGAKIGTFVEVKNSEIGAGAKVPHLSYIGDADVGEGSNIAAGNITANYDGKNKHRTTIGKGVRTSVDTSFVAPVTVGDGAYTGAGSVITEDVPDGALGIARSKQTNVEGYAERKEKPPG